MKKCIDLTGKRFGKLVVIEKAEPTCKTDKHIYWKCSCDCGNYSVVSGQRLRDNITKSCGCINDGKSYTRLYAIWKGIKSRCLVKNSSSYKNYGARGIVVCKEWLHDFHEFYEWAMKNGYNDNLSIDRIDVNGNYEPSNCRWVSIKVQNNNTRRNHYLEFNGNKKTIAEWSEILGIKQNTLLYRLRRGWSLERALSKEVVK